VLAISWDLYRVQLAVDSFEPTDENEACLMDSVMKRKIILKKKKSEGFARNGRCGFQESG
jgi:hypothetical protein